MRRRIRRPRPEDRPQTRRLGCQRCGSKDIAETAIDLRCRSCTYVMTHESEAKYGPQVHERKPREVNEPKGSQWK